MVLIPSPSPQTLLKMAELGLPLDDSRFDKETGMEMALYQSEIALLEQNGITYEIVINDLQKHWQEICRNNLQNIPPPTDDQPVHMKYGSQGGFYSYAEMVADLDSMRLLYPNLCTEKVSLGECWEGHQLWMTKISDNPEIYEGEPEAFFDAAHHAREPGGMAAIMYVMWYLLENYGTDPEVTYVVDNRELYFVPLANPDGYYHNQQISPGGGGMWRKNRRNNGGSYGVDLNRNYPYQWGYDNYGSSPTPSSSTYRGPSAGSEPETQGLMNFVNQHEIKTAMTIHSNSGVYITAYGYANVPPQPYDIHMEYLAEAAKDNGYGTGYCYPVMYASNGRTQDWQLHQHGIINIEPEIGSSSFWPGIGEIMPDCEEQFNCMFNLFWCAGGKVIFSSLEVEDGFLNPGESDNLIVTVFNQGMGTSEAVDFELTTIDPYVTLINGASSAGQLSPRASANNSASPFVLEVDQSCPLGHIVEFTVTIDQAGFTRTAHTSLRVGEADIFFADNAESGMGNWTVSSGWGLCNVNPHNGNYSFNESPTGNYSNNTTRIMTLTQPLNLSNANSAWMDFYARWDIESNYDFCQIEASTDGINWTPLAGNYTQPGSGIGVQQSGQPGYEGSQAIWVNEQIDLNQYIGQSFFKFRFELKSDGGVVGDGFFVDDFQILGFTGVVTPPDVDITLTPVGAPITIPAGGGTLEFNVEITNNENAVVNIDVWTMATLPNGSQYGPLINVSNYNIPAGAVVNRDRFQIVPANAPAGDYTYDGYVGSYPNAPWSEDSFPFTKSAAENGGTIFSGWENWGESFEGGVDEFAPLSYNVMNVYPNPFNPETNLSFNLAESGNISLIIYNVSGNVVTTLTEGWYSSGAHELTFDASNLTSGVYFAKLTAGDFQQTQKLLLIK